MEQLTVTAISSDGTAKATLSRRDGIAVALRPGFRERHADRSLAMAVSDALSGVLKGYARATAKVFGRDLDAGFHPEMDRRMSEIVTRAQSRDGYVKAERRGELEFEVRFRPGTLGVLTVAELGAEIESAVMAVGQEHDRAVSRAHRTVFEPGL